MSRLGRLRAEFQAGWRSFVRRRTAVFFTFFFPAILIVIFGALVQTGSGGLFAEPPAYYVPGYLAVVVLFTPLSRVSSTVARHREGNRFEKLATTPLGPGEWLLAHTLVTVVLVALASLFVLGLIGLVTDAAFALSPVVAGFVGLATVLFCGVGALIGRLADSQDGAIAASNAIGLPVVFLSETFVPPAMLPAWVGQVIAVSPLTYFARGVREAITGTGGWSSSLVLLGVGTVVAFAVGVVAVPWRSR